MASRKHLHAVQPGDTPKRKRMTVTDAAADGDRLDLLVAMRERVAKAVADPETPARDLASLTRRLMEIAKDIDVLMVAERKAAEQERAADEPFDASAI